eukprot:SAG22_NODE_129_length_18679_cov_40.656028_6_plen_104_part_00
MTQSLLTRKYDHRSLAFPSPSDTLSNKILPRYLSNNNFYNIYSLDGRIKDAAHRVVHDVKNVGFALDGLYSGGVLPACKMVWFTARIGSFLGAYSSKTLNPKP